MHTQDLALNNAQGWICCKLQPNQTIHRIFKNKFDNIRNP